MLNGFSDLNKKYTISERQKFQPALEKYLSKDMLGVRKVLAEGFFTKDELTRFQAYYKDYDVAQLRETEKKLKEELAKNEAKTRKELDSLHKDAVKLETRYYAIQKEKEKVETSMGLPKKAKPTENKASEKHDKPSSKIKNFILRLTRT